MKWWLAAAVMLSSACAKPDNQATAGSGSLWGVYDQALKRAKYVDLTHRLTPAIPVWAGFGPATFGPTVNPEERQGAHLQG